ncbi:MAG: biopolymer transporter ExbD [Rhodanobacteraceae bacterium]
MRLSRQDREDFFEINVISLIDVLLTLLMFFVLTTTFVQQANMKVSLPEASAEPSATEADTLIIGVDRQGRYFIGNNEVPGSGTEALKQALQRSVGDKRNMPVLLRADGLTPNQAVVSAMDALSQLGFSRLRIATTPSKQDSP